MHPNAPVTKTRDFFEAAAAAAAAGAFDVNPRLHPTTQQQTKKTFAVGCSPLTLRLSGQTVRTE